MTDQKAEYRRLMHNYMRRLRYNLVGKQVQRKTVANIGEPVPIDRNGPKLIPVQFSDSTFGVLQVIDGVRINRHTKLSFGIFCGNGKTPQDKAVRNSTRMPAVDSGFDRMKIWSYPKRADGKFAYIEVGYNFRGGMDQFSFHSPSKK